MIQRFACFAASTLLLATPLVAQTFNQQEGKGPRLGREMTQMLRVGVVVTAEGGPCRGLVATTLAPAEWPEQHVEEASRNVSPSVTEVSFRDVGTARQMVVGMPFVASGDECGAAMVFELRRRAVLPPADTSIFVLPNTKKLKVDTRVFLAPSMNIESTNQRIKLLAKDVIKSKTTAWEKVEALYDNVRERVRFLSGPLKSTTQTLKDGTGDSEEMSSLFVAFCRACDIPARLVFLACPGHAYAEFYLEDGDGQGYWFPCRPAGVREFGGIEEFRPIIQKGDSFTPPDRPRERMRYISEFLTGNGGSPRVKFIREIATQ